MGRTSVWKALVREERGVAQRKSNCSGLVWCLLNLLSHCVRRCAAKTQTYPYTAQPSRHHTLMHTLRHLIYGYAYPKAKRHTSMHARPRASFRSVCFWKEYISMVAGHVERVFDVCICETSVLHSGGAMLYVQFRSTSLRRRCGECRRRCRCYCAVAHTINIYGSPNRVVKLIQTTNFSDAFIVRPRCVRPSPILHLHTATYYSIRGQHIQTTYRRNA